MCGIVGYVGPRDAVSVLVEGLSRLEYRGYDSAGVAVLNGGGVETRKLAGRIGGLRELLARAPLHGSCGIGHTRWATHGAPTERNAHPHADCTGTVALVHNGIIENADVLRRRLEEDGHRFVTETDTETLVHLIEESAGATLEERVIAALDHVEGTYGIAVVAEADPGKIVVARRGSPVLLGVGDGEYLVASDASAVLGHTRSVVYLNDGDVAVVTAEGYRVLDREAREQERAVDDIEWDLDEIALGGYPHFMLKEICEQSDTVRSTLRGRLLVAEGTARLNGLNLTAEQCAAIRRIVIVACGTSWHAGLVGRHVLEELVGIPVSVEYASEYRYRRQLQLPGTVTIAISQSGETADTLEALRAARAAGSTVLGLVNVVGSTIAREADGGIYLHAGPEIGVASTKAFTAQVVALLLLGLYLGRQRGLPAEQGRALVAQLVRLLELERAQRAVPRSWRELPRGARGRTQAQGDLLHPCGGLPGGRDEARTDRADRREHARGVRGAPGSGLRQGRVQHAGSEGAGRPPHRDHERGQRRSEPPRGSPNCSASESTPDHAGADGHPAPAPGVSHRRLARVRRG